MLYVLVVVHNKTLDESLACRSLIEQDNKEFQALIYDNSDEDYGLKEQCAEYCWIYLGGNGNQGLPEAYNRALDYSKEINAEGHICLLDDDTELGFDFISEAKAAVTGNNTDILLPILSNNGKILSPWREKGRIHFRSYEECASESRDNLLAFNSGMVISLEVFKDYRYDEKLFLDCVDISFLTEMKKRRKRIAVIPVRCEQRFSGAEKLTREAAMKRFGIYTKDMRTYYGKKSLTGRFQLIKRAVHLSVIYRSGEPFMILRKERENRI